LFKILTLLQGGAIGLLDAIFLPLHIPGVNLEMISYGQPRVCYFNLFLHRSMPDELNPTLQVGNQAFADFVDANVNLTRITNK
jgi:hypothetical protein